MHSSTIYGVPRGVVSSRVRGFRGVDGHEYMSEGQVMADQRMLRHLAAARAKRGVGRSAVQGMSRHAARAFYRTFFQHIRALEALPTGFVTLTHGREAPDWQSSKAALHRWQQGIRGRGVPVCGTWVAELQQRGAVHYHLCLSVEGDAGEAMGIFERLRTDWLRITGDEGSVRQWRERRAFRLDMVGQRAVDRERLALYLDKARLASHQAKASQKTGGVAYGRTWGVVQRRRLDAYYQPVEQYEVDPGTWVARAITIRRCLVEIKRVSSGRPVEGLATVVPVKLWGVGLEGTYLRTGEAKTLGRLLDLEEGSREWMQMLAIKRQCDRREPGWQAVRERGVQELEAIEMVSA